MEYYEPVHARFERFCKAKAYGRLDFKDLMHDALLIAFEKFEQVKDQSSFLYFLFGIAVRVAANAQRKMQPDFLMDDAVLNFVDQQMTMDQYFEVEQLYAMLAKLPELQHECLILFEISGFSIREIALLQGKTEDAIKQQLSRGRKALAQLLQLQESFNTLAL